MMIDRPWAYAGLMRLIRRTNRLGQIRQPCFNILITAGTYETAIHRLLLKQKRFLNDTLGVGSVTKDDLIRQEVLEALGPLGTSDVPIKVDPDDADCFD